MSFPAGLEEFSTTSFASASASAKSAFAKSGPAKSGQAKSEPAKSGPAKSDTPAAAARPGRFALVHGVGTGAMARIAWQRVIRRRKVLVSIGEPPARLNVMQKLLLSFADGVLASPDTVGVLGQLDIAANRVVTLGQPLDRSAFMACPRTRAGSDATRIVYVGELTPGSGVADFLSCAIAWAEGHPDQPVEICWAGRGDLRGVLQAQVVPSNLAQVFVDTAVSGVPSSSVPSSSAPSSSVPSSGNTDLGGLADLFAHCGLLVVPSLSRVRSPFIAEAMAAGLPVLGSLRSAQVRGLVSPETGWLFDPLSADQMRLALNAALTTAPAALDEMRMAARARIGALHSERLGEGVDQTLWAMLPDLLAASGPARA